MKLCPKLTKQSTKSRLLKKRKAKILMEREKRLVSKVNKRL